MATLTVEVPKDVKDYVEAQVGGAFADSGAFIAELVRIDRERETEELRAIVEEAEASGVSTRTLDEIFDAAVERVRAKGRLRD